MKWLACALLLSSWPLLGQEGVTTLYALDPFARTLCLTDGAPGGSVQAGSMVNRCSHLSFELGPDRLAVGIQGGERGAFIDLGTPEELAKRYSYRETVGGGQGYASLTLSEGHIAIRGATGGTSLQPLREAAALSQLSSAAYVPIVPGHALLARLSRVREAELYVKFIVLSHLPGQSVTLRWAVLRNGA